MYKLIIIIKVTDQNEIQVQMIIVLSPNCGET